MPEYPDIVIYIERLHAIIRRKTLEQVRIVSPFLLRTAQPPVDVLHGCTIRGFEHIGKRIVFIFSNEYYLILHLMINGRLYWRDKGCKIPKKKGLAAFDFTHGSLLLTESGAKKRASLHVVKGREKVRGFDPGGLDVLEASPAAFRKRLTQNNHTLKRALTDPKLFSGIGNAYSDEILHRARLSPILQTDKLNDSQMNDLYNAVNKTLVEWTQRLRNETGEKFPEQVTPFRKGMAVHGRFGELCPECYTPIQRIRYANNEANYCPACQTGGKILADRALSRLLKKDWPHTLDELKARKDNHKQIVPDRR